MNNKEILKKNSFYNLTSSNHEYNSEIRTPENKHI